MSTEADFAAYPARHAMRHPAAPDSRESLAHMLVFPEHGIAGFIYPSIRFGGKGRARTWLFGPGLAEPIIEEFEGPVADDMDFDDFRLGPLRMAVRDPHKVVDLAWNGERVQLDGRWEAMFPPYAFSSHPLGNPPYYGDDRTEQHGRIVATLTIDGRRLELDGFLIRDHSWGPRVWGLNQHYKWFHATTATRSVHFFEMMSFGRRQLRGYLFKDGAMRHLDVVDHDFAFDADMTITRFAAKLIDTDGRRSTVTCTPFAKTRFEVDPMIYLNEAAITLDIDGEPGTGWCEFCWNRDYFDFAKNYVAQYG